MKHCKITQHSDQAICETCNQSWDFNDPFPPDCINTEKISQQSRTQSLIESSANVAIGYGVAVVSQAVIFPLFDIHIPISDNLLIGLYFTAISIVRSYCVRRVFNGVKQ